MTIVERMRTRWSALRSRSRAGRWHRMEPAVEPSSGLAPAAVQPSTSQTEVAADQASLPTSGGVRKSSASSPEAAPDGQGERRADTSGAVVATQSAPAAKPKRRGTPPPQPVTVLGDSLVPRALQVAASWSWRAIIVITLFAGVVWLVRYLSEVTVPLAVAVLLAALLNPVKNRLIRWGMPRGAATAVSVLGGLALIAGTLTLIGTQIASQGAELAANVVTGFNQVVLWLQTGPLHLSANWFRVSDWGTRISDFLRESRSTIAQYATEVGTSVGRFFAGFAIALFSLFYFLYDGRGIFRALLGVVPRPARGRVDAAASKGWQALSSYVRATILVALVDATGVLIVALILGVPLAPALAALVFIGAFVPLVGALVSGFVAVVVALVLLGWVQALIMLGGIIAVMQLEGHVLQPFLLGRAVKLHPLAVLLAIAVGIIVGGIVGALMAVPLLAFSKSFIDYLSGAAEPPAAKVRWATPTRRG